MFFYIALRPKQIKQNKMRFTSCNKVCHFAFCAMAIVGWVWILSRQWLTQEGGGLTWFSKAKAKREGGAPLLVFYLVMIWNTQHVHVSYRTDRYARRTQYHFSAIGWNEHYRGQCFRPVVDHTYIWHWRGSYANRFEHLNQVVELFTLQM